MIIDRRRIMGSALGFGGALAIDALLPGWARAQQHMHHRPMVATAPGVMSGEEIALAIGETPFAVGGRTGPCRDR